MTKNPRRGVNVSPIRNPRVFYSKEGTMYLGRKISPTEFEVFIEDKEGNSVGIHIEMVVPAELGFETQCEACEEEDLRYLILKRVFDSEQNDQPLQAPLRENIEMMLKGAHICGHCEGQEIAPFMEEDCEAGYAAGLAILSELEGALLRENFFDNFLSEEHFSLLSPGRPPPRDNERICPHCSSDEVIANGSVMECRSCHKTFA